MKKTILFLSVCFFSSSFFSQGLVESTSKVDWTQKTFTASLSLDLNKAGLQLPSGKSTASGLIRIKMPALLKDPVLSLFVDSENYIGDLIDSGTITLEQITKIIEDGNLTPDVFYSDEKTLTTTNTIDMDSIDRQLIKHKYPYQPEEPVDTVPTRAYTGIIIDARNELPVHGEYVKSEVYPCFFPQVWDEEMNLIYEKNVVERKIAEKKGIVSFDSSDDFSLYENRIGTDPLYIRAFKVYGRNRTDPIIRKKDALKILCNEKNRALLTEGKVVILLDRKNLVYDVQLPEKDPEYYASYRAVKQYVYENKVPDIDIHDSVTGILFSVDLKFIPDSPELLPEERPRIRRIAEMLSEIIKNNEFTILVEGHTADLGKPVGQMNLSIERTRTVMNALIEEGVPASLFTYKGYGATRPVATNETEAGRAQNRRVDITARPRATYIQRDW